jgi:hypothetical protein
MVIFLFARADRPDIDATSIWSSETGSGEGEAKADQVAPAQ